MSALLSALHIDDEATHDIVFCRASGEHNGQHLVAVKGGDDVKLYSLKYEIEPEEVQPPAGVFSVRRTKRMPEWRDAKISAELLAVFVAPELDPSTEAFSGDANRAVSDFLTDVLKKDGLLKEKPDTVVGSQDDSTPEKGSIHEEAVADEKEESEAEVKAEEQEEEFQDASEPVDSEPAEGHESAENNEAEAEPEAEKAEDGENPEEPEKQDEAAEEKSEHEEEPSKEETKDETVQEEAKSEPESERPEDEAPQVPEKELEEDTNGAHAERRQRLATPSTRTRLNSAAIVGDHIYFAFDWNKYGIVMRADIPQDADEAKEMVLVSAEACLTTDSLMVAAPTVLPPGVYLVARNGGNTLFLGEREGAPASLRVPSNASDYYHVRFGSPFDAGTLTRHVMPPELLKEFEERGVQRESIETEAHNQLMDSIKQDPKGAYVIDALTDASGYLWLSFLNGSVIRCLTQPSTPKSFETLKKRIACATKPLSVDPRGRPIMTYRLKRAIWSLPPNQGMTFTRLAYFPGIAVTRSRKRSHGEDMATAEWPDFVEKGQGCICAVGFPDDSESVLRMMFYLSENCALIAQPNAQKGTGDRMIADIPGECALTVPAYFHALDFDEEYNAVVMAAKDGVKTLLL